MNSLSLALTVITVAILAQETCHCQEVNSSAFAYNVNANLLHPFVSSPAGRFLGKSLKSRLGKWYNEFLGIPYAQNPKRFEPSILAKPMEAIYDARNHKAACPQVGYGASSEDCLFLSVAYPHEDRCQSEPNPTSLPVMVNIHGGGFSSGTGSTAGGKYLLDKCIVYVSINYRLGAFGFLATEDGVIPGNLGLKDQVVALKWVQNNIASFRGDPNRVTIFGISAGGSSVSLLIASQAAKGLFHGAIAQSGVALNPWSLTRHPNKNAEAFAKALKCPTTSSSEMRKCLLTKRMVDMIAHQSAAGMFIPFGPVIEGSTVTDAFLTQHPWKIFQSGDFNRVPLVTGFTQDEGIVLFSAGILVNSDLVSKMNKNWNLMAPALFYYDKWNVTTEERNEVSAKIKKFYFNDQPIGKSVRQNLTNLYSDRLFVQGIFDTVELHTQFAPVYPYVMSYKGGKTGAIVYNYHVPVSTHADDSQYLFNTGEFPFGSEQFLFSSKMISLWTSFATTGKPVSDAPALENWDAATLGKANEKWFDLTIEPKTLLNYLEERRQFWKDLGIKKYEVY